MKKTYFIILIWVVLIDSICFARDFRVECVEENYKEIQADYSNQPIIFHSLQINSEFGPKLLILKGDDYNYRKWIRHNIAQNKKFITAISDDRVKDFISADAYAIDVQSIFPFNGEKWISQNFKQNNLSMLKGENYILVVDPDEKRTRLIQNVAERMQYQTSIFSDGEMAFNVFKQQPEKFKMIIFYHNSPGMPSEQFADQVVKLDQSIPLIIDTGYQNESEKNKLIKKFPNSSSIHFRPVMLRDLQKTIERMVKKNV